MNARTIKALVVDDEQVARQVLRDELELVPDVVVVGEAENGKEALRQIADLQPDVVLLDLQMPVMGGFEVVRNLAGSRTPLVVMVTAFQEHAIQAFEAGAIDYVLKPVRAARLHKALDRARTLLGKTLDVAQNGGGIAEVTGAAEHPASRKLIGRIGRDYFLLDTEEVLALQAAGELVWILTAKRRLVATQTLGALEQTLPASTFRRVHRNAIVNVNHIRKMSAITSHRWMLTLSNQSELVVSKRQAHSVRRLLQLEAN